MRIFALGRTGILLHSIIRLSESGHKIVGIATCKSAPEYSIREADFKHLSEELEVPFFETQNINNSEIVSRIGELSADVAVSVNWVSLIGSKICGLFRHGILNAHAGDLPRYRGNAPVAWAIINGEKRIGLTVHEMDPLELDAGPVLLKRYFELTERTYIHEVFTWIEQVVPGMFLDAINGLEYGDIIPKHQTKAADAFLRCYPRIPADGKIDWKLPSELISRIVRASAEPFSGSFAFLESVKVIIWRARAEQWTCPSLAVPGQVVGINNKNGEIAVATGDGVLILEEIGIERNRYKPQKIINSMRDRLR